MNNNEIKPYNSNRSIGLAIASLVLGIISIAPTVYSTIISVESIKIALNPNSSLGEGLGSVFLVILLFIVSIIGIVLSTIGLGLGIASIVRSNRKKVKNLSIIATVISGLTMLLSIASFVVRLAIS